MGNSVTCTRRFQFCMGHRVHKHESKCNHPHGHNYVLEVFAMTDVGAQHQRRGPLDEIGRVIDFSVIKEKLGPWIDKFWDHGFLLFEGDEELVELYRNRLTAYKHFLLPNNPTAENIGLFLLNDVCPTLFSETGVVIYKIIVHETENCFATVEL